MPLSATAKAGATHPPHCSGLVGHDPHGSRRIAAARRACGIAAEAFRLWGYRVEDAVAGAKRRFQLMLIKPSHYNDDGYVIRWWRALIPSNSLASDLRLSARLRRSARRSVPDVEIDIDVIDETNTRVNIPKLHPPLPQPDGIRSGWSGRRAVKPVSARARHCAGRSVKPGSPVAMGGFHVSGCLSMLDGKAIDLDLARASSASRSLPARLRSGSMISCCKDAAAGRCGRSTIT